MSPKSFELVARPQKMTFWLSFWRIFVRSPAEVPPSRPLLPLGLTSIYRPTEGGRSCWAVVRSPALRQSEFLSVSDPESEVQPYLTWSVTRPVVASLFRVKFFVTSISLPVLNASSLCCLMFCPNNRKLLHRFWICLDRLNVWKHIIFLAMQSYIVFFAFTYVLENPCTVVWRFWHELRQC